MLRTKPLTRKAVALLRVGVKVVHAVSPGVRALLLRCVERTQIEATGRGPMKGEKQSLYI